MGTGAGGMRFQIANRKFAIANLKSAIGRCLQQSDVNVIVRKSLRSDSPLPPFAAHAHHRSIRHRARQSSHDQTRERRLRESG